MIGNSALGKVVSPDAVTAIARSNQGFARLRLLLMLFALAAVHDAGDQDFHGLFFVAVLAAVILALHHDSGRQMRYAYRRIGFIDVLAPGARGSEGVNPQLSGIDFDGLDFIRLWHHCHRTCRRMNASLGFSLGNALNPMPARFKLKAGIYRLANEAQTRKSLIGSGDRSDRIRTYNFPQGRITDHRINLTLYKIDAMMDGDIDDLCNALASEHQAELLAALGDN